VEFGIAQALAMPAIASALFARFDSRDQGAFAARLAAALRNEFGGHALHLLETGRESA
jgi:6-phosphogluconate dehydrogenase